MVVVCIIDAHIIIKGERKESRPMRNGLFTRNPKIKNIKPVTFAGKRVFLNLFLVRYDIQNTLIINWTTRLLTITYMI